MGNYYFIECNDDEFCELNSLEINYDTAVKVYIKYADSFEMLKTCGDDVLSIECMSNELYISRLHNTGIEDVLMNIIAEVGNAEICSEAEFMEAYNDLYGFAFDIIGN